MKSVKGPKLKVSDRIKPVVAPPKEAPTPTAPKPPKMDRRSKWRMLRLAEGICTRCAKEPIAAYSRAMCGRCLGICRERQAARIGSKRRNLNAASYAAVPAPQRVQKLRRKPVGASLPKKLRAPAP
jgi:hypothetical protein